MKILIADDHPLFRAAIRHVVLQLAEDGVPIDIKEAEDHASVIAQLEQNGDISLLLLDLAMPGLTGLLALEMLTARYPALPIVVLSASESRTDMQRSLDLGALGFVPKSSSSALMLQALRLMLAGGIYVPPALVQREAPAPTPASQASGKAEQASDKAERLTPCQAAVLAMVMEGMSNKVIAARLGRSEATVKVHVSAILKALGVTSRTQAVIAAARVSAAHS